MEENQTSQVKKQIIWAIIIVIAASIGLLLFFLLNSSSFLFTKFSPYPAPIQKMTDIERFTQGKALLDENLDESLNILKSLAADEQADPYYRAKAIAFLGNLYINLPQDVAINKLFSGDMWGDFYQPGASNLGIADDIYLAGKNAFEWSFSIAPTALANYRIASWYITQLQNNPSLSPQTREQYIEIAKERIVNGESIFENDRARGMDIAELQTIYIIEGLINGAGMYVLTQEPEFAARAISSYEKAINIDPLNALIGAYQLANLLRIAEGEKQNERTRELLDFVVNTHKVHPNFFAYRHFTKEGTDSHKSHLHTQHLIDTALYYPPFHDLLLELGWLPERFEAK